MGEIRQAATVVILREREDGPPELLMAQRAAAMSFAGGALVFPGGAVDEADRERARALSSPLDDDELAARLAAVREVMEECALRLALESLVPFARWCPPATAVSKRFDTRFYLSLWSEQSGQAVPDGSETERLMWITAANALDLADRGEARMMFPTRRNLERLAQFADVDDLIAHAEAHPVQLISPWTELREGVRHLCIPEGHGYPVTSEALADAVRE